MHDGKIVDENVLTLAAPTTPPLAASMAALFASTSFRLPRVRDMIQNYHVSSQQHQGQYG